MINFAKFCEISQSAHLQNQNRVEKIFKRQAYRFAPESGDSSIEHRGSGDYGVLRTVNGFVICEKVALARNKPKTYKLTCSKSFHETSNFSCFLISSSEA
jgi:hypothetical protein